MKKLKIVLAVALFLPLLTACDCCCSKVNLKSEADSVSYVIGYLNGAYMRKYELGDSVKSADLRAYVKGFKKNFFLEGNAKVVAMANQMADGFKSNFADGFLFGDSSIILNYNKIFEGIESVALRDDTKPVPMSQQEAQAYLYSVMSPFFQTGESVNATIDQIDSLNYVLGVLNGWQLCAAILPQAEMKEREMFIETLKKSVKKENKENEYYVKGTNAAIMLTQRLEEVDYFFGDSALAVNTDVILKGVLAGLKECTNVFESMEDAQECWSRMQENSQKRIYAENIVMGEAYFAELDENESVISTESGLRYEIIQAGNGVSPNLIDTVLVNYEGRLIDGTVFDSSYERKEPISFGVSQVIPGWTEGLQLMSEGAKFRFHIPYDLAYGARQAGQIPPYSTLIFDVELLEVRKANIILVDEEEGL